RGCDSSENTEHHDVVAARPETGFGNLVHRHDIGDRSLRIDFSKSLADRRQNAEWIAVGANRESHLPESVSVKSAKQVLLLRMKCIDTRLHGRRLHVSQRHVPHHSDNSPRPFACQCIYRKSLADRILTGPKPARHRFVDDGNPLRCGGITVIKVATAQNRSAHGMEEARRYEKVNRGSRACRNLVLRQSAALDVDRNRRQNEHVQRRNRTSSDGLRAWNAAKPLKHAPDLINRWFDFGDWKSAIEAERPGILLWRNAVLEHQQVPRIEPALLKHQSHKTVQQKPGID